MIKQTEATKTYERSSYRVVLNLNGKDVLITYNYEDSEFEVPSWDYEIDPQDEKKLTEEERGEISDFIYSNELDLGM